MNRPIGFEPIWTCQIGDTGFRQKQAMEMDYTPDLYIP
jgi:hypothetical protein